jgi:inositol phosphorylceramide mannosyltransferase catalytic subunit
MKIPRIIHQTWKDLAIPRRFVEMSNTWKKMHPDWEYILWTDEMNRDFIKEQFPLFLPVYDSYEANIQRVDAVRYFILLKYGGVFVDLDFECRQNIQSIINSSDCVFGIEPQEHCSWHDKDMIISNAFMAAVPGSPFIRRLCTELETSSFVTDNPNIRVLETTGPFMLSRIYKQYDRQHEVTILPAELLYPLTKNELLEISVSEPDAAILEKINNAYGIHHYVGTWWDKKTL